MKKYSRRQFMVLGTGVGMGVVGVLINRGAARQVELTVAAGRLRELDGDERACDGCTPIILDLPADAVRILTWIRC